MFDNLMEGVNAARHHIHVARGTGRERMFLGTAGVLEHLDELLVRAEVLPLAERWVPDAEKALGERIDAYVSPAIDGYEGLNAKTAAKAVRLLDDRVELARVRRYEAANKDRKTVYEAVDAALTRLNRMPEAWSAEA
ncbi:MAG: hypothetical protein GY913_00170 [Proteobacteria bacterium]|nr:hypothetical protein [Pseudomonadota bacterium]MCP4915312.1 hypothetical protein [Pseudomonadota bacterium]